MGRYQQRLQHHILQVSSQYQLFLKVKMHNKIVWKLSIYSPFLSFSNLFTEVIPTIGLFTCSVVLTLRIPAIHGAKTTKNQTPLVHYFSRLRCTIKLFGSYRCVTQNSPFLSFSNLFMEVMPTIGLFTCHVVVQ